jgi:formate dehydrogenase beta subunit
VLFHYLAAPTRLMGDNGKLSQLEYIEMELGEPDESGRRRPVPKEGTEKVIAVDNVIAAIGQFPATSFLTEDGVAVSRWKTVAVVNEITGETNIAGVFAGGDAVTGASIAVEAIGAGRRAARSIHLYLRGEEVSPPQKAITAQSTLPDVEELHEVAQTERVSMPELSVADRALSFKEVEVGLDEKMACGEADRCLSCGLICYRNSSSAHSPSS